MPPPQCPECGRFLSNDFVQGLLAEDEPCPRCGSMLQAAQFRDSPAVQQAPEPLAASVRPPDLPPESVRRAEDGRDVLEGWDERTGTLPDPDATAGRDELLVTVGTIVVAGVAGGLVGALVAPRHRSVGTAVGTLVAAAAAAAGSRIFAAPPGELW